MLLRGVNDSPEALRNIATVLERVEPDEIHLSTPTRPPAEPWVKTPGRGDLERACLVFGNIAKVLQSVEVDTETEIDGEVMDAILSIVSRHPLQELEVVRILERRSPESVLEDFSTLAHSKKINIIERHGKRFWCAAGARFPDVDADCA
jgi:wyosine [tRNA(Phe)-imidazoG37] synthetase (radical SAM superfamily)